MSEITTLNSQSLENISERLYADTAKDSVSDRLQILRQNVQSLPSVLDVSTLQKLRNDEYQISLKEYSNLNTYRTAMNNLYGDKSADKFQNYLDKVFKDNQDKAANAKNFIEKMRENGLSNSKAIKQYTAMKTYSLASSYQNYSFIKAKI